VYEYLYYTSGNPGRLALYFKRILNVYYTFKSIAMKYKIYFNPIASALFMNIFVLQNIVTVYWYK